MKYKYKLNHEIHATQFKGDGIADLIILEKFLGIKPEIVYFENGGAPQLCLKDMDGEKAHAHISDFIIDYGDGRHIIMDYRTFLSLFEHYVPSTSNHKDNLAYSLSGHRKAKGNKKWKK